MYNKKTILSSNRIKSTLKRYFWILVIVVLLAGASLYLGIQNNKKNSIAVAIHEVKSTFLFSSEENKQSMLGIIGDMKIFAESDTFKNDLENYLLENGMNEYLMEDAVDIAALEGTNCFQIIVNAEESERAKLISEFTNTYFNEKMNTYYSGIQTELLEQKENVIVDTQEDIEIIQLKDLLIAVGIIAIGVLIVYCCMLLDDRIMCESECCVLFGTERCLSVKTLKELRKKFLLDDKENNKIFILPQTFKNEIGAVFKDISYIDTIELDAITENKIYGKKQWIILYNNMKIQNEYDGLYALNTLNEQEIEGIIFIKHI